MSTTKILFSASLPYFLISSYFTFISCSLQAPTSLCNLMTPGLRKDIWCHVSPYFILCLQIPRAEIQQQEKLAVNLVTVDGHLNLLQGFVWVCM